MSVPYRRLSAFYFCYFAILGSFLPFWSLYLAKVGFDATEIGELTALLVATKIIAPNIWGWLADKSGKRLSLIRLTSFLSCILFAGFFYRNDFSWFALVTIVFSFFWNASLPQFEAATLSHIKTQPHRYSSIRLWGSVGFIAAVLGIGQFLDFYSIEYLPVIIIVFLVLNYLVALITPETKSQKKAADVYAGKQVTVKSEVIAFFVVYMLLQVSHGPYYVFYSLYLEQNGYSAALTGQLWALGVCAEILMFIAGGSLLKIFSARRLLLVSLCLSMVRWLLIAYQVDSRELIVVAQLLHSVTFGLAHIVAIQLLSQYFGEHHLGKGQAFYSSLSFGLGGMLGSLYSGYFWDNLGASQIYVIASFASGLGWLIAFVCVGRGRKAVL